MLMSDGWVERRSPSFRMGNGYAGRTGRKDLLANPVPVIGRGPIMKGTTPKDVVPHARHATAKERRIVPYMIATAIPASGVAEDSPDGGYPPMQQTGRSRWRIVTAW